MKQEFMITISKENDRGNIEVAFMGSLEDTKRIYLKMQRLNDLQFPETKSLKKEHDRLLEDIENEGVKIFEDDEYIEDEPIEWDLHKIKKFSDIEVTL